MAFCYTPIKIIKRSKNKNALSSAAYRSGGKLKDEQTGKTYNYSGKKEVVYSEIDLPHGANDKFKDRQFLWNSVEKTEKRKDAQLARDFVFAFPKEFDVEVQKKVMQQFVADNLTSIGMICDWSIHEKEGNPHAHLMATMRSLADDGLTFLPKKKSEFVLDDKGKKIPITDANGNQKIRNGKKVWKRRDVKTNDWDNRNNADKWKQSWCDICNQYLSAEEKMIPGLKSGHLPTVHEGAVARKIERQGGIDLRCEYNRKIRQHNRLADQQHKQNAKTEIGTRNYGALLDTRLMIERTDKEIRADAIAKMKKQIEEYCRRNAIGYDELTHDFDFSRVEQYKLKGVYNKNREIVEGYFGTLPISKQNKYHSYAVKTRVLWAVAAKELKRENEPVQEFKHEQQSPKKAAERKLLTKPPIRSWFTEPPIKLDTWESELEKKRALRDYDKAERDAERIRRRMQDDIDF